MQSRTLGQPKVVGMTVHGVTHVRLSNDQAEWSRFRLRGGSTEDAPVPPKPPSASLLRLPKFTCFVVCLGLSDLSLVTLLNPIHLLLRVAPASGT